MRPVSMNELDRITGRIIGCAIEVHRRVGPGLLESIYNKCLVIELQHEGLNVSTGTQLPLVYRDIEVGWPFVADLLVENTIVVEVKSVTALAPVHSAQLVTYLRLGNFPAGLLINFNVAVLRQGVRRLTHPSLYRQRQAPPVEGPEGPAQPSACNWE